MVKGSWLKVAKYIYSNTIFKHGHSYSTIFEDLDEGHKLKRYWSNKVVPLTASVTAGAFSLLQNFFHPLCALIVFKVVPESPTLSHYF